MRPPSTSRHFEPSWLTSVTGALAGAQPCDGLDGRVGAGAGFDHPPLDTLVLAMPISWKGTLQQYAGRLHREHADKASVRIIDFVDAGHPALLRMWEKRQRGYRSMGYRIAEAQTAMQVMPQSIHPNAP